LTPEKWNELADKLTAELAGTEAAMQAARSRGLKLILAAGVLSILALVLAFIGHSGDWGMIAAFPPLLLGLFTGAYGLRQFRIASLARADIDRIQHDIRMWKKKKPAKMGSGTGNLAGGDERGEAQ
jgi:hypothetical protein